MELTILGSGTAVPSLRRGASGYLLRAGGDTMVFDAGSGTMARLLAAGVEHHQVSHIFCTHNHLDHSGELPTWLFAARIPAHARTTPLTIGGSAGFTTLLATLRQTYGHWLDATTYPLTIVTLRPGATLTGDGWRLEAFPVSHIESSLAYRVTDQAGRVFAYSGDSQPCDSLVDLARDADLLLIEASTPDGQQLEGHMTPAGAGAVARRAGARKVVMTHFYPACDAADMLGQIRRVFDGVAIIAEDGMKVEV